MNDALRTEIQQAVLLCQWIAESPHRRGSINGQAAQVGYALSQALAAQPQPVGAGDGNTFVVTGYVNPAPYAAPPLAPSPSVQVTIGGAAQPQAFDPLTIDAVRAFNVAVQPQGENLGIAAALRGHIRTLRLSGRNDGLVEDMAKAVVALEFFLAAQRAAQPELIGINPEWTPADEAMRWLNDVELSLGKNGPTIKLRAALSALIEAWRPKSGPPHVEASEQGAQRVAQPLTDEQVDRIADGPAGYDRYTFARAIERAHGIGAAKEQA